MIAALQSIASAATDSAAAATTASAKANQDLISIRLSNLKELESMHDKGQLTQEQYESMKADIWK